MDLILIRDGGSYPFTDMTDCPTLNHRFKSEGIEHIAAIWITFIDVNQGLRNFETQQDVSHRTDVSRDDTFDHLCIALAIEHI